MCMCLHRHMGTVYALTYYVNIPGHEVTQGLTVLPFGTPTGQKEVYPFPDRFSKVKNLFPF